MIPRSTLVSALRPRLLGRVLLALAALGSVAAATSDPRPANIAAAVSANGFAGRVLVAAGTQVLFDRGFGPFRDGAVWPWQSVTKQVIATLVMQQVAAGTLALDAPSDRYLPSLSGATTAPTVRELLQHRSGLRNPDDTPAGPDGMPSFYTEKGSTLDWCLGQRTAAGGDWRYNNCDYIVLGAMLERVTGQKLPALYAARIARPLGLKARFVSPGDGLSLDWPGGVTMAERPVLARFGSAGGLAGTPRDLFAFDSALLHGKLLTPAARATMWDGDAKLGYQALGQWSFEAKLKGCADPVRIIERRGGIGRFQARNLILPGKDMAIIVFTNRPDFDFGEIWQGKGFSFDLLSAAAC